MDIATNLRHLREKSGLTQIEVCQRAHISQSTYSAYESGNSVPKIRIMSRLADVFSVSVATIDPSLLNIGNAPDPFLQIINACWDRLTVDERAKVAGIVRGIVEEKNHAAAGAGGSGAKIG